MKLALALALALIALARPALADEAVPRAAVEADMLSYYDGEEDSAFLAVGLGIAAIGIGIPLVTESSDFARGLGVPLLSLGALEGIGGLFYAYQVRAEIRHYQALLASDPVGFAKEERAHIEGTQARFGLYLAIEIGLAAAGVAFAGWGFAAKEPLNQGIGIGLFSIGAPFFIIDNINNVRASRYYNRVKRFDPKLAVAADSRGWRLALGTRF